LLMPPSLAPRQKSGNACDSDTQLRGSPPGVARESVLPTEALMRAHGTRRARRRGNPLRNWRKRKHLDVLPTPVSDPPAAKRSTSYIHESRIDPRRTGFSSTKAGGGKRRRTALTRRARLPLAPDARALLAKRTVLTIGLGGHIHSPLS
jgi:hypothetical protein